MTTNFVIRVRRGDREVEVQGPSEEFVREVLTELVEEHLNTGTAVTTVAPGTRSGEASTNGQGGDTRSFRDLLNAAPSSTAAEKCLLAAYLLHQQGQPSFGSDDVNRVFDEAMERQINFHREVRTAVQRGWAARAQGDARYRIVHSGILRVRELTGEEGA
jgi:hypothetical protein